MLRLSSTPHFSSSSSSPSRSLLLRPHKISFSSVKMSQTVEHIVLLKVKPDADPTAMVAGLKALVSIDKVLYLSAGAVHKNHPSSSPLTFTHMLHSRYETKQDLDSYLSHPTHLALVHGAILPICEDIVMVDWVGDVGLGGVVLPPGSLLRVWLLKVKDGLGEGEKEEVLRIVGGVKETIDGSIVNQFSFGENFSSMGKGFAVASVVVYKEGAEVEVEKVGREMGEKLKDLVESVVVLDYIVS